MKIPFVDFAPMHEPIRQEMVDAFAQVYDKGWFIGGSHCTQFEKDFAAWCGVPYCIGCGNGHFRADYCKLALAKPYAILAGKSGFCLSLASRATLKQINLAAREACGICHIFLFGGCPFGHAATLRTSRKNIQNICHNCACGGELAGTCTVEECATENVGVYQNAVVNVIDVRHGILGKNQEGGNECENTAVDLFGVANELYGTAQLICKSGMLGGDARNAGGCNLVGVKQLAKSKSGKNNNFVRGIKTFYVSSRI